jgi:hypothetical protein
MAIPRKPEMSGGEIAMTIGEVIEWMQSPEGLAQIKEKMAQADRAIVDLQEARKPPPDWREFRVTI